MSDVLVPLGFFAFIVLIVYLTQKHKQKKMLISMGQPVDLLDKKDYSNSLSSLKFGLVSVSLALGIFAGHILSRYTDLLEEAAYFSMIFLFGGIALLVFYFISNNKENKS